MTVAANDILRVVATLVWTDGNIVQNVFNAIVTGGGAPWADADIVDDALDWVEVMFGNLTTQLSDEIDGSQVQVYKYDSGDGDWDEVGNLGWVFNPSNVGEQMPRGVAGLMLARTTDPDVSGKKYIGGVNEGNAVDGLYTAGMLVALLAFAEDWVTAFTGSTSGASWAPGVWSPTETAFFSMIDNYTVNAIPAYQRRRKRGVGA